MAVPSSQQLLDAAKEGLEKTFHAQAYTTGPVHVRRPDLRDQIAAMQLIEQMANFSGGTCSSLIVVEPFGSAGAV